MLGSFSSVWEKKGTDTCKDILRYKKGILIMRMPFSYWVSAVYLTCTTRYLLVLQKVCGSVIRRTYCPLVSVVSV